MQPCPCQSELAYEQCCAPYHRGFRLPETAEQLMRSRYAAYVLQEIAYIVDTIVPTQQNLLDKTAIAAWAREAEWLGLNVHSHTAHIKPNHAQVAFTAHFAENGTAHQHSELSAFVQIGAKWHFIDPTVPFPSMKSPCICGSQRKFKACCGQFFK